MKIFNGKSGENAFIAELRWSTSQRMILLLSFLLSGLPLGIAGGLIAFTISYFTMGVIATALVTIGLANPPIFGPIVIGMIITAITGTGVFIFKNKRDKGQGPQSAFDIKDPIDVLGAYVAKIVFIPVVGFAVSDSRMDQIEMEFIKNKMSSWGYSDDFIEKTLAGYENIGLDGIKKEIINTIEIEGSSKYIKNNAKLSELVKKSLSIIDELRRVQGNIVLGKENYLDWLRITINV